MVLVVWLVLVVHAGIGGMAGTSGTAGILV